jgi:hypothetical protein
MLRAVSLAMTILVLARPGTPAFADNDLGANAALKYWQGFATLPTFSDADAQKLHLEYLTMPLDGKAREMVAKADYSLKMLQYGAAQAECNWALAMEEGVYALLPYVPASRVLTSLSFIHARMHMEEGHRDAAIDDIVSALTLGRHVSVDGSLIAVLVGYAIEQRAQETLALYLVQLDAASIQKLKTRLDRLPAGAGPADGLKIEEATLEWFIRKVKEKHGKDELVAFLGELSKVSDTRDDKGQGSEFLEECGGTTDGVVRFAEELRPFYGRAAKMLDLPMDRFVDEWNRESAKGTANPVFQRLFPAIAKVRESQARHDVRRALLDAAIDIRLKGADAQKDHLDPLAGKPLEYTEFDGGFELRLKLDEKLREKWHFAPRFDEVLFLRVGRRP